MFLFEKKPKEAPLPMPQTLGEAHERIRGLEIEASGEKSKANTAIWAAVAVGAVLLIEVIAASIGKKGR